ncbi:MAG: SAM-dependent chlorinase/fluorinase, partial [Acidimicrobiales bacterium]|nr:SAM-dependent chlorinase/fluorinase [Acidimicrobiales bacterium]
RTRSVPEWLVGPDNGLLLPLADSCGGVAQARQIDRGDAGRRGWAAEAGARTFDGRDLFGPAAGHLVTGGGIAALGPELDPAGLVRTAERAGWRPDGAGVVTTVRWVDRFGNVQLDIRPAALDAVGLATASTVDVQLARGSHAAGGAAGWDDARVVRRVDAFSELGPQELGLLVDANGRLCVVVDRSSAAAVLGHPGDGTAVRLSGPA